MNFLGLVAGLDLRHPGVKLPGFGRIGVPRADRDRRTGAVALSAARSSISPQTIISAATMRAGRSGSFRIDDRDQRAEQHAGFAERRDDGDRRHRHRPDRDAVGDDGERAAAEPGLPERRHLLENTACRAAISA